MDQTAFQLRKICLVYANSGIGSDTHLFGSKNSTFRDKDGVYTVQGRSFLTLKDGHPRMKNRKWIGQGKLS